MNYEPFHLGKTRPPKTPPMPNPKPRIRLNNSRNKRYPVIRPRSIPRSNERKGNLIGIIIFLILITTLLLGIYFF